MPQDRALPGTPQDWLARAKSDLALVRMPLPEGAFLEDLCFHAQQAAEKALKAVYVYRRWSFRYTHDLEELVTGLQRQGLVIPPEVGEAAILTSFAWEARLNNNYRLIKDFLQIQAVSADLLAVQGTAQVDITRPMMVREDSPPYDEKRPSCGREM